MPSSSSESSGPLEDVSNRRNPRRSGPKPDYSDSNYPQEVLAEEMDHDEDEYENPRSDNEDAEDEAIMEEAEGEEQEQTRGRPTRSRNAPSAQDPDPDDANRRTSSRRTKFKSSMKEPRGDSISDLLRGESEYIKSPKSPAARHSSKRKRVHDEDQEDDSFEEDNDEDGGNVEEEVGDNETEDEMKIQRIIASRTEPRRVWNKFCKNMNTSEVDSGSRWFQDDKEGDDDTFEERFLVKWDSFSFIHCSWETESDLVEQVDGAKKYLRTFFKKSVHGLLYTQDERCDGDYFDPAFTQIDRILEVSPPENHEGPYESNDNPIRDYGVILDKSDPKFESGTGRQFLVKWNNMTYSDISYEFEQDLLLAEVDYIEHVEAFYRRSNKPSKNEARRLASEGEEERRRSYKLFGDNIKDDKREEKIQAFQKRLADHIYPNGGQLRDYQAEGISFLLSNYINNRSSILADEMGLGKTLQTCAFIDLLATRLNRRGPFLVIVPLSTLEHWKREFTTWTGLNTFIYHGSAEDRSQIREFEMAYECDRPKNALGFNQSYLKKCFNKKMGKYERLWMAQVVITTPEVMCASDFVELTAIEWEVLVVDEAHRMKNHNSKLSVNLRDDRFSINYTLLLTGTPIQNNMAELWTLLNFVHPERFENLEAFIELYGDIKSKEKIDELHETIRPYILRRLKEDVEKSVPPKEETLIEVELTILQKQYYRALYEKNVQFLHRNKKALDGPSISNLAMQLRKCCNHPFLLRGVEEDARKLEASRETMLSEGDFLVKSSGKLVLLDKLLPKLKENGHRILMFSQFKIMLDILEDYLVARKWKSERIDGSITGRRRQMAIDRFQTPQTDSKEAPFVMLLSTRAGGVGINLTAADTCIIFDSDWNPQNDLQAQARCHRIGQTKSVKVYRLLTRKTYEMQMFHMSSLKMGLDQAVLQGFENGGSENGNLSKDEIEKLLRHGAYEIFNEEKAGTSEAESTAFVQQDIDSILERRARTVVHENTGSQSNGAGSTFSKASFRAGKTNDTKGMSVEDVDVDDPDFWKKMVGEGHKDEGDEELTGKKRKRKEQNYSEKAYDKQFDQQVRSQAEEDSDSVSSSAQSIASSGHGSSSEDLSYDEDERAQRAKVVAGKEPVPKERKKWGRRKSAGFERQDAEKLLKGILMYGYGNMKWPDFINKLEMSGYRDFEVRRMAWSMVLVAVCECAQDEAKRKAERAAAKKQTENETGDSTGGVLATVNDADSEASPASVESAFERIWNVHESFLSHVLHDATFDSEKLHPRKREKLNAALKLNGAVETVSQTIHAAFAQNLWPALKSRGWSTEVSETVQGSTISYRYKDRTFSSPGQVIPSIALIHPELANAASALEALVKADSKKEKASASDVLITTFGFKKVEQLANMFAPLELLVDRTKPKRLSLGKKLLSLCLAMRTAHDLARGTRYRVGSDHKGDSNDKQLADALAERLDPKKAGLPLPCWTPRHDAVLIVAIAKHGWIEYDRCCRDITEDSTVRWGAPFDEAAAISNSAETRKAAHRAAKFLNVENEIVQAHKEIRQHPLMQSYNLEYDSKENGLSWKVMELSPTEAGEGTLDLPTKKDLLRRARALLFKEGTVLKPQVQSLTPTNHSFTTLDVKKVANTFLAELLRSITKISFSNTAKRRQLGEKLFAYALDEATSRIEDLIVSCREGEASSAEIDVMKKVADHISFAHKFIIKQQVEAKNVLRVVLGLPPQSRKTPTEPLFPVENQSRLTVQQSSRVKGNSNQKNRKRGGNRRAAHTGAGEQAIERAVGVAFDAKFRNDDSGMSPDAVELSGLEILLLTVMCSQGVPVWTADWLDLVVSRESLVPENQGPGYQHSISWHGMGEVLEAAANAWYQTAQKKHDNKKTELNRLRTTDPSSVEERERKLQDLERDMSHKRVCFAIARDYNKNPMKLAKKSVMLLDKLRSTIGVIDMKRGPKQTKARNMSENGLGPRVLEWMTKEIQRWATSLGLLDVTGHAVSLTALDFEGDSADEKAMMVSGVMVGADCRPVFSQIAQQSRLRSIFIQKKRSSVVETILRAADNCNSAQDVWEDKPSWWGTGTSESHDIALLEALLEWGYSGLHEMLADMAPEVVLADDEEPKEDKLTTEGVQYRANQLTRELDVIVHDEEMLRSLRGVLQRKSDGGELYKTSSATSVQPGIQSFFKAPGTSNGTSNGTPMPKASMKRKETSDKLIDLTDVSPDKKTRLSRN